MDYLEANDESRGGWSGSDPPKFLLVGYNGANNTGSEARLLSIIEDIRTICGEETPITVPTLNEKNLRRYIQEDEYLRIAPIPSIYFFAIKKLVREHDLVMLVEGSCYMDTWTSALLWAFLSATKYAAAMEKPSIAYAVDSGELSDGNRKRVARIASKTDLILMRSHAAADRMRSWGVDTDIRVTGDTAFTFKPDDRETDPLGDSYSGEVVGLAPVDFYLWPVVIRPWGRKENCYKWPYYFSRSEDRKRASEELAGGWALEGDRLIEEHGMEVALIAMEGLDESLARQIKRKMEFGDTVKIFSSNHMNASQMTNVLAELEMLITSRYHAAVLSLRSGVPQVAIGHDLRLKDLYRELDITENYFDHDKEGIWGEIPERVDHMLSQSLRSREKLIMEHEKQKERARLNRKLLKEFIEERVMI